MKTHTRDSSTENPLRKTADRGQTFIIKQTEDRGQTFFIKKTEDRPLLPSRQKTEDRHFSSRRQRTEDRPLSSSRQQTDHLEFVIFTELDIQLSVKLQADRDIWTRPSIRPGKSPPLEELKKETTE